MNNDQINYITDWLEHLEHQALNMEISLKQLRDYIAIFKKEETENEQG
jgi:hypothetical protein